MTGKRKRQESGGRDAARRTSPRRKAESAQSARTMSDSGFGVSAPWIPSADSCAPRRPAPAGGGERARKEAGQTSSSPHSK